MQDETRSSVDFPTAEEQQASRQRDSNKSARLVSLDSGQSRTERIAVALVRRCRSAAPTILLMLTDIAALIISILAGAWFGKAIVPLNPLVSIYPFIATYCAVLLLGYLFSGLYSVPTQTGAEELKRTSLTTTMAIAIMALIVYASGDFYGVHAPTFLIAWAVALFSVPLARFATRRAFSPCGWWGHKAIIISVKPQAAQKLVQALRHKPALGIKPAAVLSVGQAPEESHHIGVPILNGPESVLRYTHAHGIHYAIVTSTVLHESETFELIQKYENFFKHWLIVPDFSRSYSLWVKTLDLNGLLGLEVTNKLNKLGERAVKRALDLVLTLAGGIALLPLCLLIAIAVKLDSRGTVFYGHERLGKNGRPFKVLKFRSMLQNADSLLDEYLKQHPQHRQEWHATRKLKNDPRITAVGRFLRSTSLDELPQLINVLRGDMSLVGPRPIVAAEICRYDHVWELYQRTRPGITGQWQVSGRNDTSYEERTAMDAYYVRNWSIWLDIYILAKTPLAVLHRSGAY
ncbi:MAG: undecaprenyl-phosphate galactose phosphotransferase WbaP [Gammaproteobacteria bacterium]|nr:undecaprenyl-phosphate galactose phosphotransferase WbaP [Gammaproteobacteria bacterium]